MQKQIILLQIIAIAISYVSLNDEQHCDCQELEQHDCELIPYWCSWNNETCISHNQNCETFIDYDTCLFKGSHCQWISNSTHKYCETQNSSDYNTSLDCLQHSFYWFNETCSENFTKCDEYSIEDCIYLKECEILDDKCIDYQYPNCTDDKNCLDRYTSSDKTHKCKLIDEKCYKIEINNLCISFNDSQILCELYLDCLYEDSKCRLKTCSDILDSTECDNYIAKENGNDVWCEWKDEKCQNMIEITKLDEITCFTSTFYNYIWKDKKCELCPNLKSNTPKYEPISHTNITNETQPNTTEITPTDPVIIDLNNRCACSQFSEIECEKYSEYCTWDSDLYKCRPYDSICSSKKNIAACEYADCVWNSGSCTHFTSCTAYSSYYCPLHLGCLKGNSGCQEFNSCYEFSDFCPYNQGCSYSYSYCSTTYSCSSYSIDDCEGKYYTRNYPCYLDNYGKCTQKKTIVQFDICEDFDDSKTHCELMKGCAYINDKCIKGKCFHFSKERCDVQRNSNSTQTLCQWDETNNQCGYAKLNSLSQTECLKYKNLKYPNYSSCTQCTEIQDNHLQYIEESFKSFIEKVILLELIIILIN